MRTQVQKWGNSLAIRIPKAFAADLGIEQDGPVDLTVEDGALVLRPLALPRYELKDLLANINNDVLHAEVSFGDPTGAEEW